MKVKAVIMRPDRTNDVVVIRKKKIEGKTFRHGDCMYFLHPDRFQVTWNRVLGIKKYYATYYFKQGASNALPVPDFPDIDTLGTSSEELSALFNPWFYRIIAQQSVSLFERIQFILLIAIACGIGYLIFQVSGLDPGAAASPAPVPSGPVTPP